jgi:hypothetical protein
VESTDRTRPASGAGSDHSRCCHPPRSRRRRSTDPSPITANVGAHAAEGGSSPKDSRIKRHDRGRRQHPAGAISLADRRRKGFTRFG